MQTTSANRDAQLVMRKLETMARISQEMARLQRRWARLLKHKSKVSNL